MYWPVGDFHDETTRVLGGYIDGFSTQAAAKVVIDKILTQQHKPHHVSYRVAEYTSLTELRANGVLV